MSRNLVMIIGGGAAVAVLAIVALRPWAAPAPAARGSAAETVVPAGPATAQPAPASAPGEVVFKNDGSVPPAASTDNAASEAAALQQAIDRARAALTKEQAEEVARSEKVIASDAVSILKINPLSNLRNLGNNAIISALPTLLRVLAKPCETDVSLGILSSLNRVPEVVPVSSVPVIKTYLADPDQQVRLLAKSLIEQMQDKGRIPR